ncbi:putative TOX high mobility group box protein [Heracleum sosnowskyi]|uniref:TOX high mobility group box protein n=1 Tax=Heracleum sosnowskyi TaxID=360622 RepID=A0AAD8IYX6_9APIA|nr:putative TOX high mobility group box protein [Heracleum sosnowskyi]
MEDMASLWNYQESIDELKQKLLYANFELEAVKSQANDNMKQLFQLLKKTMQERNEARDQLDKLVNKLISPSAKPTTEIFSAIPRISPENPLVKPTRANSSITESNSFSDQPYNYHTQNSSPVESLFDAVTSPDFSNLNNHQIVDSSNMAFMNHEPFVQDYNVPSVVVKVDQASLIIDNLVKGKTLPQKGNLVQSVLGAGPLLQTLLVAGPLPKWKNPPPLQAFHIPPVSIKGCNVENIGLKVSESSSYPLVPMNSKSSVEMSCVTSQMIPTSVVNYGNGAPGSCAGSGRYTIAAGNVNNTCKRQRFH